MYFDPLMAADKVLKGTEKMDGGQITAMTIVGLLVVFSALLILVMFLYGSGSIFKKASGKPKAAPAKQAQPPKKPAPAPAAPAPKLPAKAPAAAPVPAQEEDEEVIAVIMAAISAMGAAEGKSYQLKSVTPVGGAANPRRAWANAGLISQTRPF